MNQATRRPDTGGGRVVVVVGGTNDSIRAQACCCLFFIVLTLTRASSAHLVAFVCMLCQWSTDELEAAARVSSGRSHRMAARRRRMVPMAALRAVCGAAPSDFVLASGFCVVFWTMHRPGEILLGLCYILTKVEAASLGPALASVKTLAIRPAATQQPIFRAHGRPTIRRTSRGTARSGRAALIKFQRS